MNFLLAASLILASCGSFWAHRATRSWERPEECRLLFQRLDEAVTEAGVRDAASSDVPGFPYLRVNRFLLALKKDLGNETARDQWTRWMRVLDLQGRRVEIANLPAEAILSLAGPEAGQPARDPLYSLVESCSSHMLSQDHTREDFYPALEAQVGVPDDYSSFLRIIGLYPLAAIPFYMGTDHVQQRAQNWFSADLEKLPLKGRLRAFVPEENASLDDLEKEKLIRRARENPLGIPLPQGGAQERLVRSFAPVFLQDVAAPYDYPGRVVWKGDRAEIDPDQPTVYFYFSHAFLKEEPVLQINYVAWYSARAGKRPPWFELGHLDGLTVRISLDGRGKPFMVDVINNCGCYHFFAPKAEGMEKKIRQPSGLDPFVPQWLPIIPPGERLGVRVNSGWHQVERLLPAREMPDPVPYRLLPYEELESMAREGGRRESLFDSRGIAKGTERVERFIFFPMGVPSVGSMRQRGHHAIEFIGRAHFDDPDLFNQNFVFR